MLSFGVYLILNSKIMNISKKSIPKASSTTTTVADKDSYVTTYYGLENENFGQKDYLDIGFQRYLSLNISYLHFSFKDKPTDWQMAEISIYISEFSIECPYPPYCIEEVSFKVYLIEESWNESTITHDNQPSQEDVITTLNVSKVGFYKIKISDYIDGNEISIRIAHEASMISPSFVAKAESREGNKPPQLIWSTATANDIPSYPFVIFMIILVISLLGLITKVKNLQTTF